jgi:hypothetical protein
MRACALIEMAALSFFDRMKLMRWVSAAESAVFLTAFFASSIVVSFAGS